MELKIKIGYKQILGLISQLPKKEKEKIASILQSEITSSVASSFPTQLLLDAPTWNVSDFIIYKEARNHINNSRVA